MAQDASVTPQLSSSVAPFLHLQRSGVIQVDPKLCLACRECEVACSLLHEAQCNPELSRIRVDFDDFVPGLPDIRVCKQCDWPACYYACLAKWGEPAILIDPRTGARYVDESLCRACGACARACPLTPERPVIHEKKVGKKRIRFKCDLCKDRPEGPVCVEVCPGKALTFISAEGRK
jgi:Fe-S-cluster-containing hydrogenase component 2